MAALYISLVKLLYMFHKITKQQDIRKNHYWTIMLEKMRRAWEMMTDICNRNKLTHTETEN